MQIGFSGEAGETQERLINELQGLTVEVHINTDDENIPDDHPAIFDAQLLGTDPDSEWYDAIRVRHFDEESGTGTGDPFTVRAERIVVY
jgi:hypothetical protein